MPVKNHCYGCTERHAGCHASCKKYAEYKKALEAEKKEKTEYMTNFYGITDAQKRAKAKHIKAKIADKSAYKITRRFR